MAGMVTLQTKGDFKKLDNFLEKCKNFSGTGDLDKFGRQGVEALIQYSPKDTGLMSESWDYVIERDSSGVRIVWTNSDIESGYNVALLVQYGHMRKDGTYYEGFDFVNPAMKSVFDNISQEVRKEVEAL